MFRYDNGELPRLDDGYLYYRRRLRSDISMLKQAIHNDINKHWSEIPDFSVSCLPPYRLFPTDKEYTRERNDILSAVESLLSHQAKLQPNITTGLKYSALPEIATWQGTIVAMRIPYMNRSFNYINFVE